MVKVFLACAAGMSSSMLVEKIKQAAKQKNIKIEVDAGSTSKAIRLAEFYDVFLISPQVRYILEQFKAEVLENQPQAIFMEVLQIDYGRMNGDKILSDVLELSNHQE